MTIKKLEYKDDEISIIISLHTESLLTLENDKVMTFLTSVFNLGAVSGNNIKTFNCTNGLPIYEYIIKRKDDAIWNQEVEINDGAMENSAHKMDVPEFWDIKVIQCIMEVRKLSTELMYEYKVSAISVKWN